MPAACPATSVYGQAKAFTPLLAEPLQGPVYLRTSASHKGLPEMVVALRGDGGIAIDLAGRIDSTRGGGIRASFEALPDAPVANSSSPSTAARRACSKTPPTSARLLPTRAPA